MTGCAVINNTTIMPIYTYIFQYLQKPSPTAPTPRNITHLIVIMHSVRTIVFMDDMDSVWLGLLLEGEMPATHSPLSMQVIIIGRGSLIKYTNTPTELKQVHSPSHFSYSLVRSRPKLIRLESGQVVGICMTGQCMNLGMPNLLCCALQ